MFVFGCGRCDLADGDPNVMYDNLRHLGSELPSNTIIHPGHNYAEKHTLFIPRIIPFFTMLKMSFSIFVIFHS